MSVGTAPGRTTTPSWMSRLAGALRMERPLSLTELAMALVALGCVGALALGPRILHGGFVLDDWSNATISLWPPGPPDFGHAMSEFAKFTLYRPVLVIYVPLTYFIFGTHMHYHLALAAGLAVIVATMFYGVLRTLRVPWGHALLLAALTIVFPWYDSTRLWVTGAQVDLSIGFMFAGLFVALQGLRRGGWRWHAAAVSLYLLSILTYEITIPLIASLGALYWVVSDWRAAKWRWLADLGAVIAAAIWIWANTVKTKSGLSENFAHFKEIVEGAGTLLGWSGYPLGSTSPTELVLAAIAVTLCLGLVAYFALGDRFRAQSGWGLRSWLALVAGGLALSFLGWVIFVPAEPYYTPVIYGEANRVNGLAGFGLILVVYGSLGTLSTLLCSLSSRTRAFATATTLLLGLVLLASYTHVLRRHIQIWNTAYIRETIAIAQTKKSLPHLPPGTTVIASSYPANEAPGVPIFTATWDYASMIRLEYEDVSLDGYPLLETFDLQCRPHELVLVREGQIEARAQYGAIRMLDLSTGRNSLLQSPDHCKRVAPSYVPGPLYLSHTY